MPQFTSEDLALFFSGKYSYAGHDAACELAEAMRVHADGAYPKALIEERRPHESEMVRAYRKKIWKPITKPYFGKVLTSLGKIRRSAEWSIRFDNEAPTRIAPGENLEAYITSKLPTHTSITNWCFSVLLREYAIDANAWVAVMPEREEITEDRYIKPRPFIFHSSQVIDYGEDFLVVLSDETSSYKKGDQQKEGEVYYVITDQVIERWEQIDDQRKFDLVWDYAHELGELPAFKMRGVLVGAYEAYTLNETRLAPMVPRLDEALREYSDLQAEVVQHVYSEKWEMGEKECVACNGNAAVVNPLNGQPMTCEACHGTGFEPRGPYTVLTIQKPMPGEAAFPTPPMGYVQKSTEIVTVQDKRVDGHIFHALAAVNMEFLTQTPAAESGIAKAYDADETNNFVHLVAEDLVAMLDGVVRYISEMRYRVVIPDADERATMLPVINVPDRFDLFSAKMVEDELTSARTAGLSPVILAALEIEYANKKFNNDPQVRARVELTFRLDPLPQISEDNKVLMLQNGGISREAYVISCNLQQFITRALDENGPEFYLEDLETQRATVLAYAVEQINATSAARQVLSGITTG